MPSNRRSSRLAERRCSLQSLVLTDQTRKSAAAKTPPKKEPQQQQPRRRRSKRIQELNAKKQSLSRQPSSPVSVSNINDLPEEDDLVPKMASLSIITPIKTPSKVRFGNNSVAKFSGCDPPMHMERLSPNASRQIFPHRDSGEDDVDELELDDETQRNCHILAQWDDSFDDELDHVESDDESVEVCHVDAPWREAAARVIVEEEQDILTCSNVSHRPKSAKHRSNNAAASSRPIKRVDEYFCKSCGHGMRRTSRYIYEED